ncbi:MAG: class I SAM-dependent methyltransferase [Microgenomates group bacterium]
MNRCAVCLSSVFEHVYSYGNGSRIAACTACGLVQVLPHFSSREVAAKYYDDWKHFAPYVSQSSAHRAYFRVLINYLERIVPMRGKKMLDVGCATGLLVDEANNYGMHAEGIDISKSAVLHGKKQHLPLFCETSVSWMKKKKNTDQYDVITALSVIEHDADPVGMLQSLYTMTKPNGMVVLSTPNFDTVYRKLMGSRWVGYQHPEHLWIFTPKTITKLLTRAGFTDVVVRRDFQRQYSVSYAFKRLGDYIPSLRTVFAVAASFFGALQIPVMINPWGDMLVIARRTPLQSGLKKEVL